MKRLVAVFALLGLAAAPVRAADAPARVAVKAARLIDGRGDRPIAPAVVLI